MFLFWVFWMGSTTMSMFSCLLSRQSLFLNISSAGEIKATKLFAFPLRFYHPDTISFFNLHFVIFIYTKANRPNASGLLMGCCFGWVLFRMFLLFCLSFFFVDFKFFYIFAFYQQKRPLAVGAWGVARPQSWPAPL